MDIYLRHILHKYLMTTAGCFLMALALNSFYIPAKILSGGASGMSILVYYGTGIPIGVTYIILNIPLFFIAYKYMDREYIVSTIYNILLFSFAADFFSFLAKEPLVHDMLLSCIAGGVLFGIGSSCIYRAGSSTGGLDIISALIQSRYSISISTSNFLFNILLLAVSVFFVGLEPVLYTLVTFFVMARTSNAFTVGFDFKKNFIIISDNPEAIAEAVFREVGRGVTYLEGEGAYTHNKRRVVFVVAKLTQMAKIKAAVKRVDPNAFMIIHDVNDVFGRGFTLKGSSANEDSK